MSEPDPPAHRRLIRALAAIAATCLALCLTITVADPDTRTADRALVMLATAAEACIIVAAMLSVGAGRRHHAPVPRRVERQRPARFRHPRQNSDVQIAFELGRRLAEDEYRRRILGE